MTLISVAGEYAAELAHQALSSEKNVMIFSDNVTTEDEIALKTRARDKVVGDGAGLRHRHDRRHPLAFANVTPEGNIGVIGASGTGIRGTGLANCPRRRRDQPCDWSRRP